MPLQPRFVETEGTALHWTRRASAARAGNEVGKAISLTLIVYAAQCVLGAHEQVRQAAVHRKGDIKKRNPHKRAHRSLHTVITC